MTIDIVPRQGLRLWWGRLTIIANSQEVAGLEKAVDLSVHFLRITTLSDWLKFWFEHKFQECGDIRRRWVRDRIIEVYIIIEFAVLGILVAVPKESTCIHCVLAMYVLYEIFLNLFNIVFVGKLSGVLPPTLSVERSLLLFVVNAAQIVVAFGIMYRYWLGLNSRAAIFYSLLVFGTIGHPVETNPSMPNAFAGSYLVEAQIALDFIFLAIFLSAFVGRLKAFDRIR